MGLKFEVLGPNPRPKVTFHKRNQEKENVIPSDKCVEEQFHSGGS